MNKINVPLTLAQIDRMIGRLALEIKRSERKIKEAKTKIKWWKQSGSSLAAEQIENWEEEEKKFGSLYSNLVQEFTALDMARTKYYGKIGKEVIK